jgi:hypothetical protein
MRTSNRIAKSKLLVIGFGAVVLMLTTGCSKNSILNPAGNCFGGSWAEGYLSEFQAWSDATEAYGENPTAANCTKYKSAAKSYLDAVDSIYDCIPTGDRAEFDHEIKEAKADIDREDCD